MYICIIEEKYKYNRGKFGYVSIGREQEDTRNIELQLDNILSKV